MRVLGVDPGLTRCGLGVVDGSVGGVLRAVALGVVRTPADLDRLGSWTATPPSERPFLLLDLRVSPSVVAPYQLEIIAVNS